MNNDILNEVYATILDRQKNPKEGSYVCYLMEKGIDKTLKKVGEEAAEVIIAAKNNKEELVYEVADLWFHTLILLAQSGLKPEDIYAELARRKK
ncbi:MAG: phosphoribosyl-ATP diphosphatase [Candidatus Margulisiibacteriota bacterium]|jgi:phosphoribosyl-ATP pyrophosphohydrolase/phosphoribosyl-AMP cyclohydrolase